MSDPDTVLSPNCATVGLQYGDGDYLAQNTLYFRSLLGTITTTRLKDLAIFMHAWHAAQVIPLLSNQVMTDEAIALDMSSYPNPVRSSFPTIQVSGSGDQDIPMVCCIRIDFETVLSPPWGRGSNFVCGLPRSVVNKSHIDATFADAIKAAYDTLPAAIDTQSWEWVVISNRFEGALRPEGVVNTVLTTVIPDLRIRTYRQRLPRHGT